VPAELAAVVAAGLVPLGTEGGGGAERAAGRVLDVGCGAGVEAIYLAGLGLEVIGVDSSREALRRARERADEAGVEVDWRLESVYRLPVDDAWADLVLDRGCLHGIDREDRPDYAREIERVLRSGGRLLLRGAREDDEERGLVGIGAEELDRLFPAARFTRGPVAPITLHARADALPAVLVLVRKRPTTPI
jgi:SAM-dependent methyltransferase